MSERRNDYTALVLPLWLIVLQLTFANCYAADHRKNDVTCHCEGGR